MSSGLQTGTLGWLDVASLGVAIAISGNFSGWNYGLAVGGWGGMLLAAILMAILFVGLTQIVSELAAALPAAGGFDSYVGRALGPVSGAFTGLVLLMGLAIGTGLAASFIAAYCQSMLGIGSWYLKAALILIVVLVQARGARDSVRLTLIAGLISLTVLITFCAVMAPRFMLSRLSSTVSGAQLSLLPEGVAGIFACVPFALFFFIGVEQAALGASEARDVSRTIPRALSAAVGTALVIGFSVLVVATGAAGITQLTHTDDPLYTAVAVTGALATNPVVAPMIGLGAIVSLLGTFFSLSYAGSRQGYALAVAGDLPALIGRVNGRHAPHFALALVAVIGAVAAAFDPNTVMVLFVFLLNVAYQLTVAAFIRLRLKEPGLSRPFRAVGGVLTGGVVAVLSVAVLISCVIQQPAPTLGVLLLIALGAAAMRRLRRAAVLA